MKTSCKNELEACHKISGGLRCIAQVICPREGQVGTSALQEPSYRLPLLINNGEAELRL